jgi:glycosyltransferase involved in cell wall biosynthesis
MRAVTRAERDGSRPLSHLTTPSDAVSIVFVTHRPEPAFGWFADSLARQLGPDDAPQVVIVDGLHDPERTASFAQAAAGRFPLQHVPAKPTPWNGGHRLTHAEYFAASSARNTGLIYATQPYVVFVDDVSVLSDGWWRVVKAVAGEGLVVAGAYYKHWELEVRDGVLLSSRPGVGADSRWERGDDELLVRIGGGEVFGNGFGAPRELLIELNGFDELCDPVGGEDYQLGLRIEWSGAAVYFARAMLAIESEELSVQPAALRRVDKHAEPADYMRRLREFGVRHRSTDGRTDNSHMILDILHGLRSLRSLGNYYDLRTLEPMDLPETVARFPRNHWFDWQPLVEM